MPGRRQPLRAADDAGMLVAFSQPHFGQKVEKAGEVGKTYTFSLLVKALDAPEAWDDPYRFFRW